MGLPFLRLEILRFRGKLALLPVLGLGTALAFGELSPVIPYFLVGFLFSAVFPGGMESVLGLLLPKPFKRSRLFLRLLLLDVLTGIVIVIPFVIISRSSALYSLFALPFLPLGYLLALVLRNPRKTLAVGVILFLLLTFVPPGIVQMEAQENAQEALGIHSLGDYEAKKAEYHTLVENLERRYTTYVFFSPGAQLELFARDLEADNGGDALFRLFITAAFSLVLTLMALAIFLRVEPGGLLRPSPPSLYLSALPWWFRKELANLWASRTFLALLPLMLLPVEGTLKAFGLLFLMPLASLEVLSESPLLMLSKPVGRDYLLLRFLVVSAVFAISVPFVGASFGVALFLASLVFLIGLFTRRGALVAVPLLALLFAPAIGSVMASLTLTALSMIPLSVSRFRLLRMDLRGWG
ncbi:hypothetical protein [Thermococcus sp. 21S7]|uniref:hypothetical protein n=1 Tax=Thermococcus sp. 21S7 TaxID=1638221 RepID=UPI0014399DA3|nr:hypothetical protein [Thermococcus sp. 21S7]NJE62523.1 hypothetical protein [Thermococcus sp. 21S7]